MALGLTQPLTEMSTRNSSWGWRRPVRKADNLTTFMCRLSWNLGAWNSWNPQGLSRPVMELLHLFTFFQYLFNIIHNKAISISIQSYSKAFKKLTSNLLADSVWFIFYNIKNVEKNKRFPCVLEPLKRVPFRWFPLYGFSRRIWLYLNIKEVGI